MKLRLLGAAGFSALASVAFMMGTAQAATINNDLPSVPVLNNIDKSGFTLQNWTTWSPFSGATVTASGAIQWWPVNKFSNIQVMEQDGNASGDIGTPINNNLSPSQVKALNAIGDNPWDLQTLKIISENDVEPQSIAFQNSILSIRVLQVMSQAKFNPDELNQYGTLDGFHAPDIAPGSIDYSKLAIGGVGIGEHSHLYDVAYGKTTLPSVTSLGSKGTPAENSISIANWAYPQGVASHAAVLVDGNVDGVNATTNSEFQGVASLLANNVNGPILTTNTSTSVPSELIQEFQSLGVTTIYTLGEDNNTTINDALSIAGFTVNDTYSGVNPSETSLSIYQQYNGPSYAQTSVITAKNPQNIPLDTLMGTIQFAGTNVLLYDGNTSGTVPVTASSFNFPYSLPAASFFGHQLIAPSNFPLLAPLSNPSAVSYRGTPSQNLWQLYANKKMNNVDIQSSSGTFETPVPFVIVNEHDPLSVEDAMLMAPYESKLPMQFVFINNQGVNQQNLLDMTQIVEHGQLGRSYDLIMLGTSNDYNSKTVQWMRSTIANTPTSLLVKDYQGSLADFTKDRVSQEESTINPNSSVNDGVGVELAKTASLTAGKTQEVISVPSLEAMNPSFQVWVENPRGQWSALGGYSTKWSVSFTPKISGTWHIQSFIKTSDFPSPMSSNILTITVK